MMMLHDIEVNSTNVDFVLFRYGKVRGRVVDDVSGKPVENFEVRHVQYVEYPHGEVEHEREWKPFTSPTGEFVLDEVAPPATRVEVRADGYAGAKTERFEIMSEETVEDVEIRLGKGAAITGVVVDAATGEPLPGVRVRAYASTHGSPWFHTTLLQDRDVIGDYKTCLLTMCDRQGGFRFDTLTPGDVLNLVAWRAGYGTHIVPGVTVEDGAKGIKIPMAPEGCLAATVYDDGQPAPGILLMFLHDDFEPRYSAYRNGVWTNGAGQADLSGLPAGSYKVTFQTQDRQQLGVLWVDVVAGEATELEIDLADLETQCGRVFGKVSGIESYEDLWIYITSASDSSDGYGGTSCDAEGNFEFTGLPPGEYIVIARQPAAEGFLKTEETVTVNAGEDCELNLQFE
jgi:protocatechuate 3,4-dioxygenase beta subunit